jgi:hypothetical protein
MTESDHKKVYQEYLKEKTFRTVVIRFAIKNKYVFYQICGRYIRCYVLPVISDAWVHAYINEQHICTLIRQVGRAGGKSGYCRQKLAKDFSLKYIYFFKHNIIVHLKSTGDRMLCERSISAPFRSQKI